MLNLFHFTLEKTHSVHKPAAACSPGVSSNESVTMKTEMRWMFRVQLLLLLCLQGYFLDYVQPNPEVQLIHCAISSQNKMEMSCKLVFFSLWLWDVKTTFIWRWTFLLPLWTSVKRRLQISRMRHKVKGLKTVSSLTRSIEWLSCLAAVQFYLLELLGDRNVLAASVFWEMMRAMNEISSPVTCYRCSPLLSSRSMGKKKTAFNEKKKRKKSLSVVGARWEAANKHLHCKGSDPVRMDSFSSTGWTVYLIILGRSKRISNAECRHLFPKWIYLVCKTAAE